MLKEVRATLAALQATHIVVQPAATMSLIPKPRGTSGRGDFNLANKMGVDVKTCQQIQVCAAFTSLTICSSYLQSFIHSLVNLSALDKTVAWKHQPGDEVHKTFTVVGLFVLTCN